jgi:hypothetical protein
MGNPYPERFRLAIKALTQLPIEQTVQFASYRLRLRSGWLRRKTAWPAPLPQDLFPVAGFLLPDRQDILDNLSQEDLSDLRSSANLLLEGSAPLFGGLQVPLQLEPPAPLEHWTRLEGKAGKLLEKDIKLVWEPARFSWACTLARAAFLTRQNEYIEGFWQYLDRFENANPAYLGWNWTSAQEAGLRLIAVVACWMLVSAVRKPPEARQQQVARWIATHAGRIPPTMTYARAQNNNHLLSEAAALYTAGCLLPGHPQAPDWLSLGWKWFNYGLQRQIDPDGAYVQHSTNYQRLMLQLALWVGQLARLGGDSYPKESSRQLAQSVRWLLALCDSQSGQVPNLGPNDGAYILPLSPQPFSDYRPVLQAAGQAFLGERPFAPGPWDEMALWLARVAAGKQQAGIVAPTCQPCTLRQPKFQSWAYLRAATFHSRPGHADQLHVDLWWGGHNLALDAGSYRYNDRPPWDNALVHTDTHNTLTIDERDQMTPAGRFLFLDWAQAQVLEYQPDQNRQIIAQHDGYRALQLTHRRTLQVKEGGRWSILDEVLPSRAEPQPQPHKIRLHWLVPDYPWEVAAGAHKRVYQLKLSPPWAEPVTLEMQVIASGSTSASEPNLQIYRAGELVFGQGQSHSTWGWYAPTYNRKLPALSIALVVSATPPLQLHTLWTIPEHKDG